MRHENRYLLIAAACAVCLLSTSSAFAADFSSPWADSIAVEARIGGEFFGNQWVVWKRKDTGACQAVQIGNVLGLFANTKILGTSANDTLIVQSAIENHCGKTLGAPVNNGRLLEFDARNGHDLVLAGFPAFAANGNLGNDIVVMNTPDAFVEGGLGNDDVESWGTGNTRSSPRRSPRQRAAGRQRLPVRPEREREHGGLRRWQRPAGCPVHAGAGRACERLRGHERDLLPLGAPGRRLLTAGLAQRRPAPVQGVGRFSSKICSKTVHLS